jgi:hypothetical protein
MYEWMLDAVKRSRKVFQDFSIECGMKLEVAATREEIHQCEQALGVSLPYSYKQFLLTYNGAHLFSDIEPSRVEEDSSWSDSGVLVFGLQSLLSYRKKLISIYEPCDISVLPFPVPVAYLGRPNTGEFCALDMTSLSALENPVMECDHELVPSEWKKAKIAESFESWLHEMFNAVIERQQFPEYWSEEKLCNYDAL